MIKTPVVQELCERVDNIETTLGILIFWMEREIGKDKVQELINEIEQSEITNPALARR